MDKIRFVYFRAPECTFPEPLLLNWFFFSSPSSFRDLPSDLCLWRVKKRLYLSQVASYVWVKPKLVALLMLSPSALAVKCILSGDLSWSQEPKVRLAFYSKENFEIALALSFDVEIIESILASTSVSNLFFIISFTLSVTTTPSLKFSIITSLF
jgi:hypothetical protein